MEETGARVPKSRKLRWARNRTRQGCTNRQQADARPAKKKKKKKKK